MLDGADVRQGKSKGLMPPVVQYPGTAAVWTRAVAQEIQSKGLTLHLEAVPYFPVAVIKHHGRGD